MGELVHTGNSFGLDGWGASPLARILAAKAAGKTAEQSIRARERLAKESRGKAAGKTAEQSIRARKRLAKKKKGEKNYGQERI